MPASVTAVRPAWAIEGGRITIEGTGFPVDRPQLPGVRIGGAPARAVFASTKQIDVLLPSGLDGGQAEIAIDDIVSPLTLGVAAAFATGLHQVDIPVFDSHGNLYVTYSGTRGQEVPVSIFRVRPNGTRETFSSGIVNATSMAISPDGRLYVSSRFEGTVYRVEEDGTFETFATDLGVACGLAFAADGTLFVGDRSGTLFRVDREGKATPFASIPPSVAAFHLAVAPDGACYITAPTLSAYDAVYRVDSDGIVSTIESRFGRPQGIAFDASGAALVVEALAGASGLYRIGRPGTHVPPEMILAGPGLVGVAVDPFGGMVVCSNETAYRMPPPSARQG
jgi:DNA-binding beta-propeller fold protein YncE